MSVGRHLQPQGAPLNAAALARGLGVSGKTVTHYLDLLVDLLLVRRLAPWHSNAGKRLIRSPKVFVRDSGIVHALLGLHDAEAVLGHPVVGSSFEGFAVETALALAPPGTQASFYRTSAGAEIDLVLELPGRRPWAVEVKRSLAPRPSRGFHIACDDIAAERRLVVYPGAESFPLAPDIECLSVRDLATLLQASSHPSPRPDPAG